jgi:hypothetical protein
MAIVDSQGRLFNKINLLDIGAALVILLVILGVLLPSTRIAAQLGGTVKPVEVDIIVRNVGSDALIKPGDKTSIIIRNQPYGEVRIKEVKNLPKNVPVPQNDGSVKSFPDPRPESALTKDYVVTVTGNAQITKDGPVLGNNKVKAGTKIELEGLTYDFPDLNVLDVRIKDK